MNAQRLNRVDHGCAASPPTAPKGLKLAIPVEARRALGLDVVSKRATGYGPRKAPVATAGFLAVPRAECTETGTPRHSRDRVSIPKHLWFRA